MKALVTGATGFLGRHLVRDLLAGKVAVRCFLRASSATDALCQAVGPAHSAELEIFRGDLMSTEACRVALEGIDVVYHAAAALTGGTAALFMNTVVPTRRLLGACVDGGVSRFVLVSSLAVYAASGLARGAVLDETCPVEPKPHLRDPYTFSKAIQESAAWDVRRQHGLPLVVVRPGVIYGPGRGVLSSRMGVTLGGTLFHVGGRRQLPYVYVDHCAAAIRQAGLVPGVEGQAFNILDSRLPTGREVLRMYRRAGRPVRSWWIPQVAIGPLSSVYQWYSRWSEGQLPPVITRYRTESMWKPLRFSNEKAKRDLQLEPQLSFEETFLRSI